MKKIALLTVIMLGNSFAGSCLDTLLAIKAFMQTMPTVSFYLDSSFEYSPAFQENVIRKYYSTNQILDSIYENGSIYLRFAYKKADLKMVGYENLILKRQNADTSIYTIKYYRDGIMSDDSFEIHQWLNGNKAIGLVSDEGDLDTTTTEEFLSNDSIVKYNVENNTRTLTRYIVVNSQNQCKEYSPEQIVITNYEFKYSSSGFEMVSTDVESQIPKYSYFKYSENALSVDAKRTKAKYGQKMFCQYNLIGQQIK